MLKDLEEQELELIDVGPMKLDFGSIFFGSVATRYFWVRNGTTKAIALQLDHSKPEFKGSQFKPQIIRPGFEAAIRISFSADTLGVSMTNLKYSFNDKYRFEFTAIVQVVPVALEVSR